MTFLELCQDFAEEAGVNGTQNGTVPTSVAGQTGELRRVVKWVQKAWLDIQGGRHWSFLWEKVAMTLPLGANVILGSIPAERYIKTSARQSALTSDGLELEYVPWDQWERTYSDAYIAAGNRPTVYTIRPDGALVFNGIATVNNGGAMAFTIERYTNPVRLVDDDDVPAMPEDLHDLIVQKALVRYANFDEAGSQRATAVDEIARLERDLIRRCLPEIRLGGTLLDE